MSDYLVQKVGITGPAGRIGTGSEYHIDSKYNTSMSWEDIVKAFDAKAKAYADDKRNIVFSNQGMNYAVYDSNSDIQTKYNITAIPTVVIFDNGVEKVRFGANIMFQLEADKKVIQNSVDTIILNKFQ